MDSENVELHRPVALDRIRSEETVETIEATPAERAALARRFGLVALNRLTAVLRLRRRSGGRIITVRGTFEAEVVQTDVVTLEPLPARVHDGITVDYTPIGGADGEPAVEVDPMSEVELEPLPAHGIDLGELVAQSLSLALDPYPRAEDARVDHAGDAPADEDAASPFAALKRWQSRS